MRALGGSPSPAVVLAAVVLLAVARSAAATAPTQPWQHSDFVVATFSTAHRQLLIHAGEAWRKGIRTFIAQNSTELVRRLNRDHGHKQEVYEYWPDDGTEENPASRGWMKGDTRAALTPFRAHDVFKGDYKWMLYGDDDTLFFMHGVKKMLQDFDPDLPYAITDNFWYWNEPRSQLSPRCLPCHFANRTIDYSNATFHIQPGCPCTPRIACFNRTIALDPWFPSVGQRYKKVKDCPAHSRPHPPECPLDCELHQAMRGTPHGGGGMIFSIGLMRLVGGEVGIKLVMGTKACSGGDCILSRLLFAHGFGFTDPGGEAVLTANKDYMRFDNQNVQHLRDLDGLLIQGKCDERCRWLVRNAVTTHVSAQASFSVAHAAAAIAAQARSYHTAVEYVLIIEEAERLIPPPPSLPPRPPGRPPRLPKPPRRPPRKPNKPPKPPKKKTWG